MILIIAESGLRSQGVFDESRTAFRKRSDLDPYLEIHWIRSEYPDFQKAKLVILMFLPSFFTFFILFLFYDK